jgi:hypothetical protein
MGKHVLPLVAVSAVVLLSGCTETFRSGAPQVPRASASSSLFEDVVASSGVNFRHTNGAEGRFFFIESTPAGVALFDFDNDGFTDIFLVQSGSSAPGPARSPRPRCALYRNNGNGTFTDVTGGSGLDKDLGYGHGAAVGDFDNDGFEDLFVTSVGGNHLFRNDRGSGKFRDVTVRMGLDKVHSTGYATSAAFGDYDNDGRLDLYVCYYCSWTWKTDKPCNDGGGNADYCSPELYDPDVHRLYRNAGDRFVDVSEKAGITKARGRGLAVAFYDYNDDGRQDIFVANDLTPNMLWRNNGDGTFTDAALQAGCAYSEGGKVMAGMGVALADYDRSGRESVFVTNFAGMPNTIFRNIGGGLFEDVSVTSGVALPHMPFLAFGCEFLDYDADGWTDLLVANGHVHMHADSKPGGAPTSSASSFSGTPGTGRFRRSPPRRRWATWRYRWCHAA